MQAQTFAMQFQMPAGAAAYTADIDDMQRVLPELVSMLLERRVLKTRQQREELVEFLVRDVPMKAIDMKRANLQARALERIYVGTEWLSADEVGVLGKHGAANPAAAANRWKSKGQLFAIRRDGRDMYPRYALGDDFTPRPVIRQVLKMLSHWDPLRMAGWFESTSSFLDGKRPRELTAQYPEKVVAAAVDAQNQQNA
jgi:hypothetical protein